LRLIGAVGPGPAEGGGEEVIKQSLAGSRAYADTLLANKAHIDPAPLERLIQRD
jgi:hypothetical protein